MSNVDRKYLGPYITLKAMLGVNNMGPSTYSWEWPNLLYLHREAYI